MKRRKFIFSSLSLGMCSAGSRGLLYSGGATSLAMGSRAAYAADDWPVDLPVNTWVSRSGPGSPGPAGGNKHIKMTYNSNDHKVYLVGGDYYVSGVNNGASHEMVYSYDVVADVWEHVLTFSNSGTPGFPEGRCTPGWTYDSNRGVMWMGMGQNRQANPRPGLLRGGLWSFDPTVAQDSGDIWMLEGPDVPNPYSPMSSTKIPANTGSEVWHMQYDPATDALYVPYNGNFGSLARYDLSGTTIRNGVTKDNWSHTPLAPPDYFIGHLAFALDTKRDMFVFYFPWPGKTETAPAVDRGETWEYSTRDNTWNKVSDTVLPARCCFGMVYDSANDKIVMLHGYDSQEGGGGVADPLSEVWAFDRDPASPKYHQWERIDIAGTAPMPRKGDTVAYDSHNNVIVQFGGRGWDTQPDDADVFLLRLGSGGPRPLAPSGLQIAP